MKDSVLASAVVIVLSLIVAIPLLLIGAYLLLLGINHYFLSVWRFRRKMQGQRRWMDQAALVDSAKALGGTIIIDNLAPNHDHLRVWWTQDDVLVLSPAPPVEGSQIEPSTARITHRPPSFQCLVDGPSPEHWPAFDYWAYTHYLHPQTGKAMLVSEFPSPRWLARLLANVKTDCPRCAVVRTESLAWFSESAREDAENGTALN